MHQFIIVNHFPLSITENKENGPQIPNFQFKVALLRIHVTIWYIGFSKWSEYKYTAWLNAIGIRQVVLEEQLFKFWIYFGFISNVSIEIYVFSRSWSHLWQRTGYTHKLFEIWIQIGNVVRCICEEARNTIRPHNTTWLVRYYREGYYRKLGTAYIHDTIAVSINYELYDNIGCI